MFVPGILRGQGRSDALMRLVLHAGHHKTGTSTFQKKCAENARLLLENRIYFPVVHGSGNMFLACYRAQKGDWSVFARLLEEGAGRLEGSGVMLLSAEDLENCLIDIDFGKRILDLAETKGFDSVEWVFVQRDQFDYFESLYSQLSKDGQLIRYDSLADSILKKGFYTCEISQFRWYFVFDYGRFLAEFAHRVSRIIETISFEQFVSGPVGEAILMRCGLAHDVIATRFSDTTKRNVRLDDVRIEYNYLCRFLGIDPVDPKFGRHRRTMAGLVSWRIEQRRRVEHIIRDRFRERFRRYGTVQTMQE